MLIVLIGSYVTIFRVLVTDRRPRPYSVRALLVTMRRFTGPGVSPWYSEFMLLEEFQVNTTVVPTKSDCDEIFF